MGDDRVDVGKDRGVRDVVAHGDVRGDSQARAEALRTRGHQCVHVVPVQRVEDRLQERSLTEVGGAEADQHDTALRPVEPERTPGVPCGGDQEPGVTHRRRWRDRGRRVEHLGDRGVQAVVAEEGLDPRPAGVEAERRSRVVDARREERPELAEPRVDVGLEHAVQEDGRAAARRLGRSRDAGEVGVHDDDVGTRGLDGAEELVPGAPAGHQVHDGLDLLLDRTVGLVVGVGERDELAAGAPRPALDRWLAEHRDAVPAGREDLGDGHHRGHGATGVVQGEDEATHRQIMPGRDRTWRSTRGSRAPSGPGTTRWRAIRCGRSRCRAAGPAVFRWRA